MLVRVSSLPFLEDVMSSGAIELSELCGRSYLVRFLYGGAGRLLTVPGACLLWAAMQVGLFLVLCWQRRTLWPDDLPGGISLLEDTTALGWHLLLPWCFLLLHYSSRLSQRPELAVRGAGTGVPTRGPRGVAARPPFLRRDTGGMVARGLFTAFGLLLFAYNAVTNYFPDYFYGHSLKWDTIRHPESYVVARLGVLFVWGYAVPVWASEVYAQMAALVRVNRRMAERDWLRISPYASDGFGGLGRLMVASSWASGLVLVAGLFFLAPMLRFAIWGRASARRQLRRPGAVRPVRSRQRRRAGAPLAPRPGPQEGRDARPLHRGVRLPQRPRDEARRTGRREGAGGRELRPGAGDGGPAAGAVERPAGLAAERGLLREGLGGSRPAGGGLPLATFLANATVVKGVPAASGLPLQTDQRTRDLVNRGGLSVLRATTIFRTSQAESDMVGGLF